MEEKREKKKMTVSELIEELKKLPQNCIVHVHHGEYVDNRHPLQKKVVCVRKCGVEYTRGLVEGVFLE